MYYVVVLKLKMTTAILRETSEKHHSCVHTETRNTTQRIKLNFLWLLVDQLPDIQTVVAGWSDISLIIINSRVQMKYSEGHLSLHTITFVHLFQSRENYFY
jgi:hypothetical protein